GRNGPKTGPILPSSLCVQWLDLRPPINLLYPSTSFLWWQAVAAMIGATSSHTLRHNARCAWRHREGSRNGDNIALRRTLSPLRPCGSGTANVHGCLRGVAPLRHHTTSRDTPVATHGRKNDSMASHGA